MAIYPYAQGNEGDDSSGSNPSDPGQGGEDPGQGGEDPGQGGEDPGQGGEDPGQGGEDPGQGGEDPGQGGEDPGQGGEDPGQGGEDPGQGGEDPGQGGEDPGQGGEDPGQGGEDPGQGGEDPGQGGEDPYDPGQGNFPAGVTVETPLFSGVVKVGVPEEIEIYGGGFNGDDSSNPDDIYIGWQEGSSKKYERVANESLTVYSDGIVFGVSTDTEAMGKNVIVYLKRDGYDYMPVSGTITLQTPTIADGYIPDRFFLGVLRDQNTLIANMVGPCGLINPKAAAKLTQAGQTNHKVNGVLPNPEDFVLYIGDNVSDDWRGIELFSHLGDKGSYVNDEGANVMAWKCPNIKHIDFSAWEAKVKVRLDNCPALQSIIAGTHMRGLELPGCTALRTVDVHHSRYINWINIEGLNITTLDIRHAMEYDNNGNETGYGWESDGGVWTHMCESGNIKLNGIGQNALIKIDAYYLVRHNVNSQWQYIYNAWRYKGATIEVYSSNRKYIDVKLGTVPAYSTSPNALSSGTWDSNERSTNGYKIDDPYTSRNEAQ
ncbi:MAG: hypothetical protein IJU13_03150 [Bacteroidales bacterium]|nr:hypothetical protein [Bacteroidales bacterium]